MIQKAGYTQNGECSQFFGMSEHANRLLDLNRLGLTVLSAIFEPLWNSLPKEISKKSRMGKTTILKSLGLKNLNILNSLGSLFRSGMRVLKVLS